MNNISICISTDAKSISIPLDNFISFILEEEISTPFQKGVIKLKNDNNRTNKTTIVIVISS